MLLQELLDETQGETRFKHKLKYHINGMQNELATRWVCGDERQESQSIYHDAVSVGALEDSKMTCSQIVLSHASVAQLDSATAF